MKITVTEMQVLHSPIWEEGKIVRHEYKHHPLRAWVLEFDESEIGGALRNALNEFSGEVRWLIELAKNHLGR